MESPVENAMESVLGGMLSIDDVITGLLEGKMFDRMKNASNFKKHVGLGAVTGTIGGAYGGYKDAKKNKTSKFKGALKGAGQGAALGAGIGALAGAADKYYIRGQGKGPMIFKSRKEKLARLKKLANKIDAKKVHPTFKKR